MRFYHQSCHIQVYRLLCYFSNVPGIASNMARVADDFQLGHTTGKFNGNFPTGQIAQLCLGKRVKTATYSNNILETKLLKTFYRTAPQVDVGICGILYKNLKTTTFGGFGNFLYRKRVGNSPRTYPERLETVFCNSLDMTGISYLCDY